MKIFLSHKFTGVGFDELESYLGPIKACLEKQGHEVFCSLYLTARFDSLGRDEQMRYMYCLEQQRQSDLVIGVIWHETDSYGMRVELAQAIKENQRYLLIVKETLRIEKIIDEYVNYAEKVYYLESDFHGLELLRLG